MYASDDLVRNHVEVDKRHWRDIMRWDPIEN